MFLRFCLAHINELGPDLASNMIVGRRRDADTPGLCDALEPGRDVDAIAKDIVRLDDHVADVDANTEYKAPIFCLSGGEISNAVLKMPGRSHRFDRAGELGQKPVTCVLDHATAVLRNSWLDNAR